MALSYKPISALRQSTAHQGRVLNQLLRDFDQVFVQIGRQDPYDPRLSLPGVAIIRGLHWRCNGGNLTDQEASNLVGRLLEVKAPILRAVRHLWGIDGSHPRAWLQRVADYLCVGHVRFIFRLLRAPNGVFIRRLLGWIGRLVASTRAPEVLPEMFTVLGNDFSVMRVDTLGRHRELKSRSGGDARAQSQRPEREAVLAKFDAWQPPPGTSKTRRAFLDAVLSPIDEKMLGRWIRQRDRQARELHQELTDIDLNPIDDGVSG